MPDPATKHGFASFFAKGRFLESIISVQLSLSHASSVCFITELSLILTSSFSAGTRLARSTVQLDERAMPELKRFEFRPVCRVRQLKMSHGEVIETRWKQTLQAQAGLVSPRSRRGRRDRSGPFQHCGCSGWAGWPFMSHSRTAVATSVTVRMNGSHLVEKLRH
jgi:hypothetical protein